MYERVDKPKENKSSSVANTVAQNESNVNDSFGFEDKRPEAFMLRKIQDIAVNSSHIKKITNGGNDNPQIQLKRDIGAHQTQIDFVANKISRGDGEKQTDTLDTVQNNYTKSLASGIRVMTKGLKWFTNAHDKPAAISNDANQESVAAAGYKVFWFFKGDDSVTVMMTRGLYAKDSNSKEVEGYNFDVFDDDQDFLYANTFNVLTGAFHASINYRKQDDELAAEEGLPNALPNSEIIWFMHQHAKKVYAEKNPEAGPLKSITSISREQIGNTQTLDTIFMSDENRVAQTNGTVTINEPTEEAIALLGSPNGNSAVWALIQHALSGTIDIEKIEFSKNGLKIYYMPS